MTLAYPIKAILIYFALLFAGPDVNKITIEGPGLEAFDIVREGNRWKAGKHAAWIAGAKMYSDELPGDGDTRIERFVASPVGHDWVRAPRLNIGNRTTIVRTEEGFRCEREAEGGVAAEVYTIRYASAAYPRSISVNVLGEVVLPGVYQVAGDTTLVEVLGAAGGWTEWADQKSIRLLRGAAGRVREVTTYDLRAIRKGAAPSPRLQERDTIHVTATVW